MISRTMASRMEDLHRLGIGKPARKDEQQLMQIPLSKLMMHLTDCRVPGRLSSLFLGSNFKHQISSGETWLNRRKVFIAALDEGSDDQVTLRNVESTAGTGSIILAIDPSVLTD